jgi:hypothetical protein
MKTSLIAEALKSHALLCFVYGTADTQQTIAGFDVLRADSLSSGRARPARRCTTQKRRGVKMKQLVEEPLLGRSSER